MPSPVDTLTLRGVAFESIAAGEGRILDAALAIAAEGGTGKVTVAAIADRLDVGSPVICAYFDDRLEIIRALLQRESRHLSDALLDALNAMRGDTLQNAVFAGVQSLLQAVRIHPQSWRFVVFSTPEPAVANRFVRERVMIGDLVATLLRPALRRWWPIADATAADAATAGDAALSVLIAHVMSLCEATVRSLLDDTTPWTAEQSGETVRTQELPHPKRGRGTFDVNPW